MNKRAEAGGRVSQLQHHPHIDLHLINHSVQYKALNSPLSSKLIFWHSPGDNINKGCTRTMQQSVSKYWRVDCYWPFCKYDDIRRWQCPMFIWYVASILHWHSRELQYWHPCHQVVRLITSSNWFGSSNVVVKTAGPTIDFQLWRGQLHWIFSRSKEMSNISFVWTTVLTGGQPPAADCQRGSFLGTP